MKRSFILIMISTLILNACAFSNKEALRVETREFSSTALIDESDRYSASEPVIKWWSQLQDDDLFLLMDQAVEHNHDIRIALANFQRARALSQGVRADRFPTLGTSASYARQRLSERGVSGVPADRTVNNYDAGFDALWELDLFGRVSQRIAKSEAQVAQSLADLTSTYVAITAEVARVYIELRGAQYRLNIARRNASNQQKTFDFIVERKEGGQSTELDVARAQTQLEQTRSTIPPLEAAVDASIHQLSVLVGQEPDALHDDLVVVAPLPSLPETVKVGNVSTLLSRRPDIFRAEEALKEAYANYYLSRADLFPEVSILGSLGFVATAFNDLGHKDAMQTSIGPSINWRLLDRSRVRAEIEAADATTQAKLIAYDQVVLEALEELKTSMVRFTKEEERRQRLIQAADSSARAAELARSRFHAGLDNFLDVLDAERTQLQAEDALAQGETQVALNLISIYKALGGGWEIH